MESDIQVVIEQPEELDIERAKLLDAITTTFMVQGMILPVGEWLTTHSNEIDQELYRVLVDHATSMLCRTLEACKRAGDALALYDKMRQQVNPLPAV